MTEENQEEKSRLAQKIRNTIYDVEDITRKGFAKIPHPPKNIESKKKEENSENKEGDNIN